jgi:hypothetical protein
VNCKLHLPLIGLAALTATIAFAQDAKKAPANPPAKAAGAQAQGEMPLPPGWTKEDMAACAAAATPGPQHKQLAKAVGTWTGKCKMYMAEGMPPSESDCTANYTSLMEGRFMQCEVSGSSPMGPFTGLGLYAFDNVSQKFQSTWVDNCGTGLGIGTGEMSPDGKSMTWNFTYNCPIKKGPTTFRQIEKWTGDNAMTMEMFGPDPKTGKDRKMMEIAYTRKGGAAAPTGAGR